VGAETIYEEKWIGRHAEGDRLDYANALRRFILNRRVWAGLM
jgi:hypothetical protein